MEYRIWHSAESFADYIVDHTLLSEKVCRKKKLYESDASKPRNFHTLPDHIKKILYLDSPDIIVECGNEPIFSIEISTEAGTGHNVFQRFARLAASVENGVPAIYIYPEAVIVERPSSNTIKWDDINPLIFKALDSMMNIYHIPVLFFYYPSYYRESLINPNESISYKNKGLKMAPVYRYPACPDMDDSEMVKMFQIINEIIENFESFGINGRERLLGKMRIRDHRGWMISEGAQKQVSSEMSPITSTKMIDTDILLDYLKVYESNEYKIGELLRSREKTVLYCVDAKFRGDPYPGALSAIDYLLCREGKTFEDRKYNLVLCWGEVRLDGNGMSIYSSKCSIHDFVGAVQKCSSKNLLVKDYNQLKHSEIPRYYMQVRYGSMYSKSKHIRVYSYFSDVILFADGALWRDA